MAGITATDHNATRRAVKAKQRANRRAAAKGKVAGGPPTGGIIQAAQRDRANRARRLVAQAANEKRLLAELDAKGVLVLTAPSFEDFDWDYCDHEYAVRQHEHNVADVKRAAKASPNRYHWESDGDTFRIARVRQA